MLKRLIKFCKGDVTEKRFVRTQGEGNHKTCGAVQQGKRWVKYDFCVRNTRMYLKLHLRTWFPSGILVVNYELFLQCVFNVTQQVTRWCPGSAGARRKDEAGAP